MSLWLFKVPGRGAAPITAIAKTNSYADGRPAELMRSMRTESAGGSPPVLEDLWGDECVWRLLRLYKLYGHRLRPIARRPQSG
ncbi:hypothetical protein MPC4_130032 [Methylocella tundrae]|uniref:Uncharacterized protein n=1 Tax=Methylocella tundrae TaxID=227605 RepID=A0A8B6M1W2_METTU|nr:hypothetical protein MPC1_1100003 [Methylocella tundrae]VTZ49011.1 hypothetical protein MPC4_130032 [Methylocella tundrae]